MESFMSVVKSMVIRGLVIYFIMSFFRKPAAPVVPSTGPDGAPQMISSPAINIFENGTLMVNLVFSERIKLDANFSVLLLLRISTCISQRVNTSQTFKIQNPWCGVKKT